jgi:2-oxoisovalerate dehydrogenase E1 component
MNTVMAEMYGKARAVPAGAAGRCTCSMPRRNSMAAMPSSGGGLPLAGGLALADKMTGEDRVTACFFGDGAVAEGEFHETLNLAELWDLPVLFVCENNGYAMGTAIGRYESQTDIRAKAAAYNIAAEAVDGMDVVAVEAATRRALAAIRETGRPSSWSATPTGSAPIPCSTPSSTATRPRSRRGAIRGPSCASRAGFWKTG